MNKTLSIIGFGEAGGSISNAALWGNSARVFDIRDGLEMQARMKNAGVKVCGTSSEAISGGHFVLSLVTADQALVAAEDAAKYIEKDALFFDMNSVAPDTKKTASAIINVAGGRYVDVAIMSPINPARLSVPLLLSGPYADDAEKALSSLGFTSIKIVGTSVGRASSIKMLRSVMYKGVEALTAECLIACEKAGVTDEVMSSFNNDWSSGADYRLDRMMTHGTRRAAEMREVVKTLEALGVESLMSRGTVKRQQDIGALGISSIPKKLKDKLEVLKK